MMSGRHEGRREGGGADLTNSTTNQLASFPGPTQLSVTSTMEKWGAPGNEASDGQHLPEKASPRCDVGQPTLPGHVCGPLCKVHTQECMQWGTWE